MDDNTLRALAARCGTPSYVFDLDALAARMTAVRAALGGGIRLCYSMKANPFLVRPMLAHAERLEVCSPGELSICAALGVPMERVVLSGVCKTPQDIEEALALGGAGVYTAESVRQAGYLEAAAAARGICLPVLPRVSAGSQFGMDEADFFALLAARAEYPHLDFCGLHYFTGTQHKKPAQQLAEIAYVETLLARAEAACGVRLRCVEYGPGLGVPYFTADSFEAPMALLEAIAPALQALAQRVELTVEMGRFFTAPCGFYLTRVVDEKRSGDTHYAFVDGGIHHVNYYGQTMAMKTPVMRHLPACGGADAGASTAARAQGGEGAAQPAQAEAYCLCGSLCTLADVLARKAPFTNLAVGDILVLCNLGAYSVTESAYLFLSRSMPSVWLYSEKEGARLVREGLATAKFNTEGFV